MAKAYTDEDAYSGIEESHNIPFNRGTLYGGSAPSPTSSSVLLHDSFEDIVTESQQNLSQNNIATPPQHVVLHPLMSYGARFAPPLPLPTFNSVLTEEERVLLQHAIADHCSLTQSMDNVSNESVAPSITPMQSPSNGLRNFRPHEIVNEKVLVGAIQADRTSSILCSTNHASSTLEDPPVGEPFIDGFLSYKDGKHRLVPVELIEKCDIDHEAHQTQHVTSASKDENTIEDAKKQDFLKSHNSLVRKLQAHPVYSQRQYQTRTKNQIIYGTLENVIDDPLRRHIESKSHPHHYQSSGSLQYPFARSSTGLPYEEQVETEAPKAFWVSFIRKLDTTAQKVVNKINPVKPAVKFFDNFQGKQKLELKKAEHHCRVDYGPPGGGAMRLNRWGSAPVLRTVATSKNHMHIGAGDAIERVDSSPDITPEQSASGCNIVTTWLE
ncbi:hypothetical protein M422DRAFT_265240 [Sphaerobolus stellatus SS14]|uniref:Uncharacterized protein n=1 Tax=Sphaerobolus stellatus (strain SS14) TaxID=990650 RepID=A0A0C9V6F5_SPHS4|nr:hypothetical protein M422DRAFT_265240 [Sphaerobolus stellatus SS14]